MKQSEIKQIKNSSKWVRINYKTISASADGYMIIKDDLYQKIRITRKFQKMFKDCLIEIILNYHITMMDIIISAIREYKFGLLHWKEMYKRELTRTYISNDNINMCEKQIKIFEDRINRLERKMNLCD